jgi:hypothetical protein
VPSVVPAKLSITTGLPTAEAGATPTRVTTAKELIAIAMVSTANDLAWSKRPSMGTPLDLAHGDI